MRDKPPIPVLPQSQPGDAHASLQIPQDLDIAQAPSRKTFPEPFFVGPAPESNSRVGACDWLSPGHMTTP